MQEQIYDMLLKEGEITWQDIIYDLVKSEQMKAWDVDISKLTQKYIRTVREMQEMNYQLSGKVLLASAILLKMKSKQLVEEDINNFDSFLFHTDDEVFEELDDYLPYHEHKVEIPKLGVRTPQARKRKVSVTDLIHALEKALKVDKRRKLRLQKYLTFNKPKIPEKKIDIHDLMNKLHSKLMGLFQGKPKISFSEVLPSEKKEDKILTILPLLYLYNDKKIHLEQEEHFGEIDIHQYK
tara:strand:- start:3393 stop:4106 length:714 start_codon:yes stop_codon:yes gene_type:complete